MLVELNVVERRYQAVLEVLNQAASVTDVARRNGVSRQTLHAWLRRYGSQGLAGLADGSAKPLSCPHQMTPEGEARVVTIRRKYPGWGQRMQWLSVTSKASPAASKTSVAHGPRSHERLCTITCLYRFAVEEGPLDRSPAAHVRRPHQDYESNATGPRHTASGSDRLIASVGSQPRWREGLRETHPARTPGDPTKIATPLPHSLSQGNMRGSTIHDRDERYASRMGALCRDRYCHSWMGRCSSPMAGSRPI